ncbi:DEAD/DEAH box helicase family protein [Actinoalloteichus fjordicus]|uniref:Type III restriction enzyme, res subunit/Helicase C-terminal domain n=1 Tax=Actinoalloteichus fjordicus TaxID=1612552 RepID=A0AAC9LE83_9PSEU|nr:DEAD/DEAH box helicase family protein [Actinoalloteichus fjordicus]APU15225.1 Type III restriction enzyme, res subunit/Helicase C-terminal domain [Actinoalloteichus fjordicus]
MAEPAAVPDFDERLAGFQSTTFKELRPGQRQMLAAYAAHHLKTPDVAIEMPTGEGKTLLALLIADYALDQGMSVAYLTGTRQLAERVQDEAAKLGLEIVRFAAKDYGGAKLDDYHQAQAVGVMNYWVYFNSKPVPQPADLVIFDDAHLAEQPLSGLQTLRIPDKLGPARVLYRTICDLVVAHTDAYAGLQAMRDGTARPGTPPELLSFSDWAAIVTASRDVIEASPLVADVGLKDESDKVKAEVKKLRDEIKWVWPKVREHLPYCGVLIGPSGIEIRPYHPPTALNAGYSQAKQRIYLSATLGSMDDLQRRIGGGRATRLVTEHPLLPGATGERMFALNASSEQALDPGVLRWALEQAQAAGGKAAWLCASHSEADTLQAILGGLGHPVYRLRAGDDTAVDGWSRAPQGQLITAGRYDGLDFPGDICKLVIITTVPQASSEFERFVVAYLGDATFMQHRVGQRVTQALGRANRTATDRSLYLGLDPTFAQVLADPAVRASIPEGTQPIVRAALELYDQGSVATTDACRSFWQVDRPSGITGLVEQRAPRRRPRPGRSIGGSGEVASADAEVSASTDLWIGDHGRAAERAREAADLLASTGETEHAAFWRYVQAHALFDRGRNEDLAAARSALEDATTNGPRTAWFRRLSRTVADLRGHERTADDTDRLFLVWDEWRREAGGRLERALSGGRTLVAGSHDQQCDGLTMLARLVGASGERPPKTEQSATDCRWTWSTVKRGERRVWEVKTGEPHPVSRGDVNQLLGQIEVETKRVARTRVYGCLLTPATTVQGDAAEAARDRITLLNHDAAVRLYNLLADRLQQYAALCGDGNAEARGEARTKIEATLPPDGWLGKLLSPTLGKIINVDDVASLFPSR